MNGRGELEDLSSLTQERFLQIKASVFKWDLLESTFQFFPPSTLFHGKLLSLSYYPCTFAFAREHCPEHPCVEREDPHPIDQAYAKE